MKTYGFFGGSFNPVTKAHIELAVELCKKYNLNKVVFVPVGNAYKKKGLADENHRLKMLEIAIKPYKQLEVSNIELNRNSNLTTLEAFKEIEKKYTNVEKIYIIGADNLHKILSLNECKELIENYKYIVIQRGKTNCKEIIQKSEILRNNQENIKIMENIKYSNISSTEARKRIKNANVDIEELISKGVANYIKENNLYL